MELELELGLGLEGGIDVGDINMYYYNEFSTK